MAQYVEEKGKSFPKSKTLAAGERQVFTVVEGDSLKLTSKTTGTANVKLLDKGTGVDGGSYLNGLSAGATLTYGGYTGEKKILVQALNGSIDAVVGDAVLAVAASVSVATDNFNTCSAMRQFGNNGTTSTGAGTGAGRIIDTQHPALGPYIGFRLIYANYDTAAPMAINRVVAAPSSSHLKPNGASLPWGANDVKFGGTANTSVLTATDASPGETAYEGRRIPSFKITDAYQQGWTARTDGGDKPLLRVRTHINDNSYPLNFPAAMATYNTAVGVTGLQYGAYAFSDAVANIKTNNSNLLDLGGYFEPVAVLFYYTVPCRTIVCGGDSTTHGTGATTPLLGYPGRINNKNTPAAGKITSAVNLGVPGQRLADSYTTVRTYVTAAIAAEMKPEYVAVDAFSPNNPPSGSQAAMDALWFMTLEFIRDMKALGIRVIILTSGPVNNYNAADKNLVLAQNARVMALPDSVIKVPFGEAVALNGNINPLYGSGDGVHYNDAGYELKASMVWAAIN